MQSTNSTITESGMALVQKTISDLPNNKEMKALKKQLSEYDAYSVANKIILSSFNTDSSSKIPFVKLNVSTKTIKNNVPFDYFDTSWDPNPIGEFPYKRFSSSELEDPKVEKFLQAMAEQVMSKLYKGSLLPEYDGKKYTEFLRKHVILDDIMMMNFSAVDWHEDFISRHPLRILIPFNTTSVRLYCAEKQFKKDKAHSYTNLSCEYKSDVSIELKLDRAITFFESLLHMAAPATKESKNSSICLTVPHPVYAVLNEKQIQKFNTQILQAYSKGTHEEIKSGLKYVKHEWWSSIDNPHTLKGIRKNQFEPWARSKGYDTGKYHGIANTPYIEPTTQNAWEAYADGLRNAYDRSLVPVTAYYGV